MNFFQAGLLRILGFIYLDQVMIQEKRMNITRHMNITPIFSDLQKRFKSSSPPCPSPTIPTYIVLFIINPTK